MAMTMEKAKATAKALARWFDTADTDKGARIAEAIRTILDAIDAKVEG